jgi:hypothetical protein
VLLGPIKLSDLGPGDHNLTAIASEVDGDQVLSQMIVAVASAASSTDPYTCTAKCRILPEGVYPDLCDPTEMVHKDYYQSQNPKLYVCYQCNKYYGFDPDNNCQSVGIIGNRGSEGCFAADTGILMEDQSIRTISELTQNDRIWNPILNRGMAIKKIVKGPESNGLFQIDLQGSSVKVTRNHPFMTPMGLIGARELKAGDKILSPSGTWDIVKSTKELPVDPEAVVWNLEIATDEHDETHHMIVANGILSGDLYLQKRIGSRNLLEMAQMLLDQAGMR